MPSQKNGKGEFCRKHGKLPLTRQKDNIKQKKKNRKLPQTYKNIGVRRYRKDKKNPKNTRITITEDVGRFEQKTTFISEFSRDRTITPKEKNHNLVFILKSPLKIGYYLDSEKCFVWSENGEYLGSLEKYHLKRLFSKIGEVLRR